MIFFQLNVLFIWTELILIKFHSFILIFLNICSNLCLYGQAILNLGEMRYIFTLILTFNIVLQIFFNLRFFCW